MTCIYVIITGETLYLWASDHVSFQVLLLWRHLGRPEVMPAASPALATFELDRGDTSFTKPCMQTGFYLQCSCAFESRQYTRASIDGFVHGSSIANEAIQYLLVARIAWPPALNTSTCQLPANSDSTRPGIVCIHAHGLLVHLLCLQRRLHPTQTPSDCVVHRIAPRFL